MAKEKYTAEEIISKLREAEVVILPGSTVAGSMERAQIHMDGRTSRIGVRSNTIRSVRSLGVGSLTLLP